MSFQSSSAPCLRPYFEALRDTPLLDRTEEAALARHITAGCSHALHRLAIAHLPLVIKVAKEYRGRGVPFEDLIGEGNVGLLEAAARFDAARGTKFITYAMWWVRKRILQAVDEQPRVVSRPGHSWASRRARTGAPDAPVPREADLDASLADPTAERPDAALLRDETLAGLENGMSRLTLQERRVIHHRFGLGGEPSITLAETGLRLRISRERVRQVEGVALSKLRKAFLGRRPEKARRMGRLTR